MSQNTINIKIALLGDCGVGKSSIAMRYTSNEFESNYESTGGASYSNKIITRHNETIQLDIWDTAGQERYRALGRNFYKDAFIVLLIFDITRKETFTSLKETGYEELKKNGEKNPLIAIVGNKSDQYESENTVNEEEARKFAESINGIFKLVSAKTGQGIDDLFNECVDKYYELKYPEKVKNIVQRRNSKKLVNQNHNNEDKRDENNEKVVRKKKCC